MRLFPLALGSLLLSSATQAEDDIFSLSIYELLELEVTSSSYFETLPLETANSVTLAQPHQWETLGVRDITELMATFPSTVSQYALGNPAHMAVRGYYNFNSSKGIAVELDGIPLNSLRETTGTQILAGFSLDGLQRIEQVRGSSSAIYGADAFHGALTLHSVAPKPGTQIKFALGNQQESGISLTHHAEHNSHALTAFFSAQGIGDHNQIYSYQGETTALLAYSKRKLEKESNNLMLKYHYQANSHLAFKINGYFSEFDLMQLPAFGDASSVAGIVEGLQAQDWSNYPSQWLAAKAEIAYQQSSRQDLSLSFYYWQKEDGLEVDLTPYVGAYTSESRQESHWGMELVQRRRLAGGADLAYGYQYKHAKLDLYSILSTYPSAEESFAIRPETGQSQESHGLFVDGRLPFTLFSTLSADWVFGIRADYYQEFDIQISPRLGLLLYPSSQYAIKLLYGHAFRKPDIMERSGSSALATNKSIQPEQTDSLELIFQRTSLNFQYSATLFKNLWHDSISLNSEQNSEGGRDRQYQNRGKNSSYGAELEGRYMNGDWDLEGVLSWVRSRNKSEGYYYDGFPNLSATIRLGYQLNSSLSLHWFNQYHHRKTDSVRAGGQSTHDDSTHFWKSNLSAHWQLSPSWQLRGEVRNLFDRDNSYPSHFLHRNGVADDGRNAGFYLTYTH